MIMGHGGRVNLITDEQGGRGLVQSGFSRILLNLELNFKLQGLFRGLLEMDELHTEDSEIDQA